MASRAGRDELAADEGRDDRVVPRTVGHLRERRLLQQQRSRPACPARACRAARRRPEHPRRVQRRGGERLERREPVDACRPSRSPRASSTTGEVPGLQSVAIAIGGAGLAQRAPRAALPLAGRTWRPAAGTAAVARRRERRDALAASVVEVVGAARAEPSRGRRGPESGRAGRRAPAAGARRPRPPPRPPRGPPARTRCPRRRCRRRRRAPRPAAAGISSSHAARTQSARADARAAPRGQASSVTVQVCARPRRRGAARAGPAAAPARPRARSRSSARARSCRARAISASERPAELEHLVVARLARACRADRKMPPVAAVQVRGRRRRAAAPRTRRRASPTNGRCVWQSTNPGTRQPRSGSPSVAAHGRPSAGPA